MPNCKICGEKSLGEYCWRHKAKKPIKRGFARGPVPEEKEEKERMFQLFFQIWEERKITIFPDRVEGNICPESNKLLITDKYKLLITCYHHLLEKDIYPDLMFCKENIVILHPDIHTLAHQDIDKTPKVKEAREKIYQKYLNGQI